MAGMVLSSVAEENFLPAFIVGPYAVEGFIIPAKMLFDTIGGSTLILASWYVVMRWGYAGGAWVRE